MPGTPELGWVDGFVDRIRPHVFVRLRDCVVIRMPNQAFKVNPTGARVLRHLLGGGKIREVLKAREHDADAAFQLESFFQDLSAMLSGRLCENSRSPSLDRRAFTLGYIDLPVLSEIALTSRCNLRCRFCYTDADDGRAAGSGNGCRVTTPGAAGRSDGCGGERGDGHGHGCCAELDTEGVKEVLGIIRRQAEVPSVSFTGGEPTLRPDLEELVAFARSALGMRVNLITNGTGIDEARAAALKGAGLASAQVSIETPDGDIHDRLVGARGAFEASVNGLKALRAAGIPAHPHSTLCRPNRDRLPAMAAFARELGIDRFSANLVIPAGRGSDPDLHVAYRDAGGVIERAAAAARDHGVRFMWYSPTPLCLFNPIAHGLGNKGCSACEGLLSVDPRGRLLPCSSWAEPLGDLRSAGFETLWFSKRAAWMRQKSFAHPGCTTCGHFAVCHGACPLYFKVHGYDEILPAFSRSGVERPDACAQRSTA